MTVLALCLLVTAATAGRWRRARVPLVRLGELALTAHLAHLLVGGCSCGDWNDRTQPSVELQLGVVLLVVAGFAGAAWLWRSRFRRGPVETALHRLNG